MENPRHGMSSFSVILVMVVLMIIGAAMIPLFNIQYTPDKSSNTINVTYNWPDVSSRLIEQEVTSKLEGVLSRVGGISEISSVSRKGSGEIRVEFKKGTKMDVARFEVSSQIRSVYPSLPDGVSYPALSLGVAGLEESPIMSYTINSRLPSREVGEYIEKHVIPALSMINGINDIQTYGITPYEYIISFDPEKTRVYGITAEEIATAFNDISREGTAGNVYTEGEDLTVPVKLSADLRGDFGEIPIKLVGGRIIHLRDIATIDYRETLPDSYYRINGLNAVNLNIFAGRQSNLIKVAAEVRRQMDQLREVFPAETSLMLTYDSSEYVTEELSRIGLRTIATLLILLAVVFAANRNLRYLLIIFLTLVANILVAFIFYKLLDLPIHIYTLAGITVSLGLIIDTSIIMTDHYAYYRDKRVFPAILGALMSTIAALCVIFLLPEEQKENLLDFAVVIIVNLVVSLFISLLFIPSLLDKLPAAVGMVNIKPGTKRRIVRFNRAYAGFISWSRKRRWLYVVILILAFGIPIHMLPNRISSGQEKKWVQFYNKTVGSPFYQSKKETFEKILGGSFRVFHTTVAKSGIYREPGKPTLSIRAGMPEGCTVHQLDELVRNMENFLAGYDEIDMFRTSVLSHKNASIQVTFKDEYDNTELPSRIKGEVIGMAIMNGGATWSVTGIDDQRFNNSVFSGLKSRRIKLTGPNFDLLMKYAEDLADSLSGNMRVFEPQIYGQMEWAVPEQEYFIGIDKTVAVEKGIDLNGYFSYLRQLLFSTELSPVFIDGRQEKVILASSLREEFDLWNIKNNPLPVDSMEVKLSSFADIDKRNTGIDIHKLNQSYQLFVGFDFIGDGELGRRLMRRTLERLNTETLPIGYRAESTDFEWDLSEAATPAWILVFIFYFLCAIIFESLRKPLVILLMIPVSFIGAFLTFGMAGIPFDQGGFASFILLCGLVVNAGIYIVNEYSIIERTGKNISGLRIFLTSYNRKIIPILLTVTSTVVGLLPFIYYGPSDVFWYSFAMGGISGMLFSLVSLVIFLPVFLPMERKNKPLN